MEADRDTVPADPSDIAPGPPRAVRPGRKSRRGSGSLSRIALLLALALLLCLAALVIWILPQYVDPAVEPDGGEPSVVATPTAPPTESETKRARSKREAENALEDYLKLQAVMEAEEAPLWGGHEYETALETLAGADASFAKGAFERAKTGYDAATGQLESLRDARPEKLQQALARGLAALDRNDVDAARREFELALTMDRGNRQALAGVERADKIEQVSGLLLRASASEAEGELHAARELLEQALTLDPASERAGRELDRVSDLIETERFNRFMSEALAAMDEGRFDEADKALSSAAAVRAGTPAVEDARRRLELARQRRAMNRHRQQADKFERAEQWHDVARELAAVIAIDPQAQFAVQGLARSRRLAALHDQLDAWLTDPERLRSPEPRENARLLLDSSVPGDDPGPRLLQKLDQLGALLVLAESPVAVVIKSDGSTNVIINRVGRLGSFDEKTVDLLPGRYVVRGERKGYRDVRLELKVSVGAPTPPLVVRCEEKI